jgi:hypothetical protein
MLLLAYGSGRHELVVNDAKMAIADTEDAVMPKRQDFVWFLAGFSVAVAIALSAAFLLGWLPI